MNVNQNEAIATIAWQANQMRLLMEQQAAQMAQFGQDHRQVVGKLEAELAAARARVAELEADEPEADAVAGSAEVTLD